jgi:hypothetical protein
MSKGAKGTQLNEQLMCADYFIVLRKEQETTNQAGGYRVV